MAMDEPHRSKTEPEKINCSGKKSSSSDHEREDKALTGHRMNRRHTRSEICGKIGGSKWRVDVMSF